MVLSNFLNGAFAVLLFLSLMGIGSFAQAYELQLKDSVPQLVLADSNISSSDADAANELGFSQSDLQSELTQKELDTREDMLRIHQVLGLVTEASLLTEFAVGVATASNVSNGSTDTSLVTNLGWVTLAIYGTTAAFEAFAPKLKKKKTGNTGIHEALSWIHFPLMILVPLTGDMLNDRIANKQPLGNLPVVHGVMATTLLLTFTSSLLVITF